LPTTLDLSLYIDALDPLDSVGPKECQMGGSCLCRFYGFLGKRCALLGDTTGRIAPVVDLVPSSVDSRQRGEHNESTEQPGEQS
jgi:hypothetical protein